MQDDAAKLVEIFQELNKLQCYQKQIQKVKNRLQSIMETQHVQLDQVQQLSGVEFEAELASNIHPFMYSYPEPLGDRYRDVQCLLEELADQSTERGIQHQRYLDTVMQFKDKGYKFALCNGSKFSPANSGLNINPDTYPFRKTAADDCLYFSRPVERPRNTQAMSDVKTVPEFFSTGEGITCATQRDTQQRIVTGTELAHQRNQPSLSSNSDNEAEITRPDSLICHYPQSTYQSLISVETTTPSSPTKPFTPSPTDISTPSSPVKPLHSCSSATTTPSSSPSSPASCDAAESEVSKYKEFYTMPVSALDPETYSKYRTVRTMVVSQTWLTGWINQLFEIESDIIDATNGKPL